jgi:hypothetical protein
MTTNTYPTDLAGQGHVLLDALYMLSHSVPKPDLIAVAGAPRPWENYDGDEESLGTQDGYLHMLRAAEATATALVESPLATRIDSIAGLLELQECEVCAAVAALADNFCAACGSAQGEMAEAQLPPPHLSLVERHRLGMI